MSVSVSSQCTACEEQHGLRGESKPDLRPGRERIAPASPIGDAFWRTASETAASYFERDRDAIRASFLLGWPHALSGEGLRERYVLEDPATADELASLVEAETAPVRARLERLADAYARRLRHVFDLARAAGPPEELDSNRSEEDELVRVTVEVGGRSLGYRVHVSADPVLFRLIVAGQAVSRELQERVEETLASATGVVVRVHPTDPEGH